MFPDRSLAAVGVKLLPHPGTHIRARTKYNYHLLDAFGHDRGNNVSPGMPKWIEKVEVALCQHADKAH